MTWRPERVGGDPAPSKTNWRRFSSGTLFMPARFEDGIAVERERVSYYTRASCQARCDELNADSPAPSKKQASQEADAA